MTYQHLQVGDYVVLGYTPQDGNGSTKETYRAGVVTVTAAETTSGLPRIHTLSPVGEVTIGFRPDEERVVAVIRDGVLIPPQLLELEDTAPTPTPSPARKDRTPRKKPAKGGEAGDADAAE